jgi:hypothetical protein
MGVLKAGYSLRIEPFSGGATGGGEGEWVFWVRENGKHLLGIKI